MTKSTFLAVCGAVTLASTMTLAARTPPTQPAGRADTMITVEGCLKPSDGAMNRPDPMAKPGDPMSTPGTATAGTRFTLTNVKADKTMGQATPSASGSTMAPAAQYTVIAGSGVNLAAHVNHQVRLMGTVDAAMDHGAMAPADKPMARPGDPAPAPAPSPAPGMADHMGGAAKAATLTVTSVTMINATCSATQ